VAMELPQPTRTVKLFFGASFAVEKDRKEPYRNNISKSRKFRYAATLASHVNFILVRLPIGGRLTLRSIIRSVVEHFAVFRNVDIGEQNLSGAGFDVPHCYVARRLFQCRKCAGRSVVEPGNDIPFS